MNGRLLLILMLTALLLGACNLPTATPQTAASTAPVTLAPVSASALVPADQPDTFWVTNPTSGARLFVRAFYPPDWNGSDLLPTLVLMPGGIGTSEPDKAARLSAGGFLIIIFDADGRGRSEGSEDYNGFITQDGMAAVITAAEELPGLDTSRYGVVSYSYGVTAAAGTLARYQNLPIDFYIDWEGPVDRNYTTVGCTGNNRNIDWQSCSDDTWWGEREAVHFIVDVDVPYQRIQSQSDHVQPTNQHAIDIINAAVAGGVPWVRLNEYPPNQIYDPADPPAMLPDELDKRMEQIVVDYATHIIEDVLSALP